MYLQSTAAVSAACLPPLCTSPICPALPPFLLPSSFPQQIVKDDLDTDLGMLLEVKL